MVWRSLRERRIYGLSNWRGSTCRTTLMQLFLLLSSKYTRYSATFSGKRATRLRPLSSTPYFRLRVHLYSPHWCTLRPLFSLRWIIPLLLRSAPPFQLFHTPPHHPLLRYPSTEILVSPLSLPLSGLGRPQPSVSACFVHRKHLIYCARRLQIAICVGESANMLYRSCPARRGKHAQSGTKHSGKRLFRKTWHVAFALVRQARRIAEGKGGKLGNRVSHLSWTRCIYAR